MWHDQGAKPPNVRANHTRANRHGGSMSCADDSGCAESLSNKRRTGRSACIVSLDPLAVLTKQKPQSGGLQKKSPPGAPSGRPQKVSGAKRLCKAHTVISSHITTCDERTQQKFGGLKVHRSVHRLHGKGTKHKVNFKGSDVGLVVSF